MDDSVILHIFLMFFTIVIGLAIQLTVANLDTSGWDFIGSPIAVAFVPYAGLIYMSVSIAVISLSAVERMGR